MCDGKRGGVCETSRMYSAASAKRASVGESEHVLAQSNVWETESERQMAASPMEGGRAKEEER